MKKRIGILLLSLMMTVWTSPAIAAGHDASHASYTARKDVAATCTTQGRIGGTYCNLCKRWINSGTRTPALGHNMATRTVSAACGQSGQLERYCTRCGNSYAWGSTAPLVHWYGDWLPNGDVTHMARCKRSGCTYEQTTPCTLLTAQYNGSTISLCPVCGWSNSTAIVSKWQLEGVPSLPQGDVISFGTVNPAPGVLYAFTICDEIGGKPATFPQRMSLTLPISLPIGARLIKGDGTAVTAQRADRLRIQVSDTALYLVVGE